MPSKITPPRPSPRGEGVVRKIASVTINLQRRHTFLKGIRFAHAIIRLLSPCPLSTWKGGTHRSSFSSYEAAAATTARRSKRKEQKNPSGFSCSFRLRASRDGCGRATASSPPSRRKAHRTGRRRKSCAESARPRRQRRRGRRRGGRRSSRSPRRSCTPRRRNRAR